MIITNNYTYNLLKEPKDPNNPNTQKRPVKPDPSTYIVEYIGRHSDGTKDPNYKGYLVITNDSSKTLDAKFKDLKSDAINKCKSEKTCKNSGNCEFSIRNAMLDKNCHAAKITRPKYRAGLLTVLKQALRCAEIENSFRDKHTFKIELHRIKYTNGQIVSLGMAYRKLTYRKARKPKTKFKTNKKFNPKSKFRGIVKITSQKK